MLTVRTFIDTATEAIRRALDSAASEPVDRWAYPEVELTCRACGFKQVWQTQALIESRGPQYDLRDHVAARRKVCGQPHCMAEIAGMEVDRFYR